MTLKEIRELLKLVAQEGISEFELERGGVRLRIKRAVNSAPGAQNSTPAGLPEASRAYLQEGSSPPRGVLPAAPAAPESPATAPPFDAERETATDNLHLVKSPIVGTFYAAPSADAEPFVRVGEVVEAGQTLCIIEAMKLMNEIESDIAGEVVKCYVANAQPVEYGEALFALRPRRKK